MILLRSFLFAILIVSSCASFAQASSPQLFFEYSTGIDQFCHVRDGDPEWVGRLIQNIPSYQVEMAQKLSWFQEGWNRFAVSALGLLVQETGVPFERTEHGVALYLCPTVPSLGTPLQVNVLYHLQSAVKDVPGMKTVHPEFLFHAMVFHELVHKYVEQIQTPTKSKLIQEKYAAEDELTKAHLHVFALQKRVWQKMGLAAQLPYIQQRDALFGVGYTRAWQIVNQDGEDGFIQELRNRTP